MKRPDFLFETKFGFPCLPPLGGNGCVKNKKLNNGSILTGKKQFNVGGGGVLGTLLFLSYAG